MMTTYELNGFKKGYEQGFAQGFREGRREGELLALRKCILLVLRKRFGRVPVVLNRKMQRCNDPTLLKQFHEQACECAAISDLNM